MSARDDLFEKFGERRARNAAAAERERLCASLIRGEAQIGGARVRIEWVDPKPDWIDAWAAGVPVDSKAKETPK